MKYDDLSREQLVSLLIKRDAQRKLGLVWERDEIEHDNALNGDFIVMDIDRTEGGSCGPGPWDNLIIEGDNFDALRWLRMTYAGQIRCIMIDPPYNTGNQDFAYNDKYVGSDDRFRQSTWLEFLYRRLCLARDLMTDDGVILVCINDDNRSKLDLMMEEVFPSMRIGSFVWKTRSGSNDHGENSFSVDHEHILVYAKPGFAFTGAAKDFRQYKNPDNDPLGAWKTGDLTKGHSWRDRLRAYYPIQNPETGVWYPCNPTRVWAFATEQPVADWKIPLLRRKGNGEAEKPSKNRQPTMEEWIRRGKIVWPDPTTERVVVWETKEDLLKADYLRNGAACRQPRHRRLEPGEQVLDQRER